MSVATFEYGGGLCQSISMYGWFPRPGRSHNQPVFTVELCSAPCR